MKPTNMLAAGSAAIAAFFVLTGCHKAAPEASDASLESVTVQEISVQVKDMPITVTMDGTFQPSQGGTANLATMVPGRLTAVYVKEGDAVQAGQLLATVNTTALQAQAASAKFAAAAASAQSRQAQVELTVTESEAQANLAQATVALQSAKDTYQSDLVQAQAELKKLRAGARPEELADAAQAVTQARISADLAKKQAERDAKLAKDGFIAGQQADQSAAAARLATSALVQAEQRYNLLKAGARPEDITAAEARLKSVQTVEKQNIHVAELKLNAARADLQTVQAKSEAARSMAISADQKQSDAQAASALASQGEIRAPYAGTIIKRTGNPGDQADPTIPTFQIANQSGGADFVGNLLASSYGDVRVGQTVNFASISGVNGVVTSVGQANPSTGLIPVRVRCGPRPGLIGQFATASIIVGIAKQSLVVPNAAIIHAVDGNSIVTDDGGKAKKVDVELGPTDGQLQAITGKVTEGTKVVLVGQNVIDDDTPLKVAPAPAAADEGTSDAAKPDESAKGDSPSQGNSR